MEGRKKAMNAQIWGK